MITVTISQALLFSRPTASRLQKPPQKEETPKKSKTPKSLKPRRFANQPTLFPSMPKYRSPPMRAGRSCTHCTLYLPLKGSPLDAASTHSVVVDVTTSVTTSVSMTMTTGRSASFVGMPAGAEALPSVSVLS